MYLGAEDEEEEEEYPPPPPPLDFVVAVVAVSSERLEKVFPLELEVFPLELEAFACTLFVPFTASLKSASAVGVPSDVFTPVVVLFRRTVTVSELTVGLLVPLVFVVVPLDFVLVAVFAVLLLELVVLLLELEELEELPDLFPNKLPVTLINGESAILYTPNSNLLTHF